MTTTTNQRKVKLENGLFNYNVEGSGYHNSLQNSKKDYAAFCCGKYFGRVELMLKYQSEMKNKMTKALSSQAELEKYSKSSASSLYRDKKWDTLREYYGTILLSLETTVVIF